MSLLPHHTSDPVCPLCEYKLTMAHPAIADWYRSKIKPKWPDSHISWSYRNKEEQEQCYLDHKTKAHYPDSKHNHTSDDKPLSLALDLFEINESGQAEWNPKFFFDVNEYIQSQGDPIIWGGTFRTIGDGDHFQLKDYDSK